MPRDQVQFATQYYPARHAPAGGAQLINMAAVLTPQDAKTPFILERVDGIEPFSDLRKRLSQVGVYGTKPWMTGNGNVINLSAYDLRGMKRMGALVYVVVDTLLYSIGENGTVSASALNGATPIDGSGRVSMAHNGTQLVITTSAGSGYVYDATGPTFQQITDVDFPEVSWVEFMDQFFIFGVKDANTFVISALADPLSYDALDIATAETLPDKLLMGRRDHRDLLLFGEDSIEPWYNAGEAFPFQRAPDGLIEVGCAAAYSVGIVDNTPFWLAREKGGLSIRRLVGRSPQRISTPAMDDEFDSYENANPYAGVSDAFSSTWTHSGRAFYAITFPSQYRTFIYDCSTRLWHRRQSWDSQQWRVGGVEDAFGNVLCLDLLSLGVGKINRDYHREWTDPLPWQAVSAPFTRQRRLLHFKRVELEIDAGRGLIETTPATQGQDPSLWLSWSDDDGRTWSNEHQRSMGRRGKYAQRITWTQLGVSRSRVFRIRGAEPIPTALISLWADYEVGR